MRVNQFVAQATGLSRRATDIAIGSGRVTINNVPATLGQLIKPGDNVAVDNKQVEAPLHKTIVLIDKPVGYVCSRDGQGSPTIYDLVPDKYSMLKHVGRLDKDSSGLVILTDDGSLSHMLSHPSYDKTKIYIVELNKALDQKDSHAIESGEVKLDNKPSVMKIYDVSTNRRAFKVELHEGRNRQVRRTFLNVGYTVTGLRREELGNYSLQQLNGKTYLELAKLC